MLLEQHWDYLGENMIEFAPALGEIFVGFFPNPIILGLAIIAIVIGLLLLLRVNAASSIMIGFVTIAIVAGFGFSSAIGDPVFFRPILIFFGVIIAGVFGYALWKIFSG